MILPAAASAPGGTLIHVSEADAAIQKEGGELARVFQMLPRSPKTTIA
jgi:hypothetical protein